jgi:hypothetical protein
VAQKNSKKQLSIQEQAAVNMLRKQKRSLTVAASLRRRAAELIVDAERNEANAAGYGKVAATLQRK